MGTSIMIVTTKVSGPTPLVLQGTDASWEPGMQLVALTAVKDSTPPPATDAAMGVAGYNPGAKTATAKLGTYAWNELLARANALPNQFLAIVTYNATNDIIDVSCADSASFNPIPHDSLAMALKKIEKLEMAVRKIEKLLTDGQLEIKARFHLDHDPMNDPRAQDEAHVRPESYTEQLKKQTG